MCYKISGEKTLEILKTLSTVNVNKEMYKILNLVMYNFVHY